MENSIITALVNYGGAVAVIGAMAYFEIKRNNSGVQMGKQLDKLSTNHLHTLQESVDRLSNNLDKHFDRLNDRVGDIMSKIDSLK